jgi:hypothetical protein
MCVLKTEEIKVKIFIAVLFATVLAQANMSLAFARNPNTLKSIQCNLIGKGSATTQRWFKAQKVCLAQAHHKHSCLHRLPGCETV